LESQKNSKVAQRQQELAESYLTKSLWLYYDWGALGKVNALRQQYGFLKAARR
jgi:hypothetical protein